MNKATYRFLRILGALMLALVNVRNVYASTRLFPESAVLPETAILAEMAADNPGNSYYVSSVDGSDANPGSITQSWRTIQHAVNSVNPGDTIYLRAGTYQEQVKINKSGQPGASITLVAYQGEGVTINGGDNMAIYSQGPVGYWVIEGLTIRSTNTHAVRFGWFHEAVTNHITLRHNYIYGAVFTVGNNQLFEDNEISGVGYSASGGYGGINDSHGGLGDDATHHNIYRNNYIHDFTNYNARGIWVQGRTHDSLVEGNIVENIWTNGLGQCIDLDAGSSTLVQWRHTVRGNRVKDCSYVGIQLENVFDSVIENNIIFAEKGGSSGVIDINYTSNVGCGVGGENNQYGDTNGDNSCKGDMTNNIIRQNLIYKQGAWGWGYGGLVNWGAGGLKVLGNTIYATGSSGNAAINFQSESANTRQAVIQNNILFNGNGVALCAREEVGVFDADDHNVLYTVRSNDVIGTGESCRSSYYSLSEYQSATGKGVGSIQADPQFVNPIADFHLRSSSPAIDAGVDIGVNKDIEGNPRLQGAGFDIGVYENDNDVLPTDTPNPSPVPTNTSIPPTSTAIPPTVPTVVTVVTPMSVNVGGTALATVNLDNVPAEGYTSAEFTCTYDPNLVEISNIVVSDLFGTDPVSAINDPQNGSFIVAIAGSNGQMTTASGVVFTFNLTSLQVGQATIGCQARVSTGNNVLTEIASIDATLTILDTPPTPTPSPLPPPTSPILAGQVLASKTVTISLYQVDNTVAASVTANSNGMFILTAPAGTYTVVATASGSLSAQGQAVLTAGETSAKATISLIAGDIDGNNVIDQYDAMTVGMNYNTALPDAADLNNDGIINVLDLEILAGNYRTAGALDWR